MVLQKIVRMMKQKILFKIPAWLIKWLIIIGSEIKQDKDFLRRKCLPSPKGEKKFIHSILKTLEYEPRIKPNLQRVEAAKPIEI